MNAARSRSRWREPRRLSLGRQRHRFPRRSRRHAARSCSRSCCASCRRGGHPGRFFAPREGRRQIIAATNRRLELEVAEGRFREDLYYRLNLVELRMPPLRVTADIPLFIEYFSRKYARRYDQPVWRPDRDTLQAFCSTTGPAISASSALSLSRATCCSVSRASQERAQCVRSPRPSYTDLSRLRRSCRRTSSAYGRRPQRGGRLSCTGFIPTR